MSVAKTMSALKGEDPDAFSVVEDMARGLPKPAAQAALSGVEKPSTINEPENGISNVEESQFEYRYIRGARVRVRRAIYR